MLLVLLSRVKGVLIVIWECDVLQYFILVASYDYVQYFFKSLDKLTGSNDCMYYLLVSNFMEFIEDEDISSQKMPEKILETLGVICLRKTCLDNMDLDFS